jgi:hypothetical protein
MHIKFKIICVNKKLPMYGSLVYDVKYSKYFVAKKPHYSCIKKI